MKHIIWICVISIGLSGCAKIGGLLTIKRYGDNQEKQHRYVEKQIDQFDELCAVIKGDRLDEYPNKRAIQKAFGEPILIKEVEHNGALRERWLYRYATKFFSSDKVYMYFDRNDTLIDWEYIEHVNKEVK